MNNEELKDNDRWKKNARTVLYAMAGFYLLTLAYNMFQAISSSKGNEQLIMIVFTILFTIIGLGMMIFGIASGYRQMKKKYDADKDEHRE